MGPVGKDQTGRYTLRSCWPLARDLSCILLQTYGSGLTWRIMGLSKYGSLKGSLRISIRVLYSGSLKISLKGSRRVL